MKGAPDTFLAECCDFGDSEAQVADTDLYDHYRAWCDDRAEQPLPPDRLLERLALRQVPDAHRPGQVRYHGISLRAPSPIGTTAPTTTSATPNLDAILAARFAQDWRDGDR